MPGPGGPLFTKDSPSSGHFYWRHTKNRESEWFDFSPEASKAIEVMTVICNYCKDDNPTILDGVHEQRG